MESNPENIELTSVERFEDGRFDEDFGPSGQGFSLPPADRGRQAWSFLAVCFLVEALVWGKYFLHT